VQNKPEAAPEKRLFEVKMIQARVLSVSQPTEIAAEVSQLTFGYALLRPLVQGAGRAQGRRRRRRYGGGLEARVETGLDADVFALFGGEEAAAGPTGGPDHHADGRGVEGQEAILLVYGHFGGHLTILIAHT
jgi:hypothetical protein